MTKKTVLMSAALCALSSLTLVAAQSTSVKLYGPNAMLTTADGTVNFPFSYYSIDAASGRKMYDDPIIQDYYAALSGMAEDAGYERSCLSRQIYLLKGTVSSLKNQETAWVKAMQGRPTFYRLYSTAKYPAFTSRGETITGTAYAFKTGDGSPYSDVLTIYGFFVYPKTGVTWVMECGSGR